MVSLLHIANYHIIVIYIVMRYGLSLYISQSNIARISCYRHYQIKNIGIISNRYLHMGFKLFINEAAGDGQNHVASLKK